MTLYKIDIRNTETGELRTMDEEYYNESSYEALEFLWEEGNQCCDSNRAIRFFEKEPFDEEKYSCDTTLMEVRIRDGASGAVLYSEFDEDIG